VNLQTKMKIPKALIYRTTNYNLLTLYMPGLFAELRFWI